MGWEDELRAMLGPSPKWAITAEITKIERHPAWGFAVHVVERPGEDDHVCRPAFLGRGPDRGLRLPYTVGDEILVIMPRLASGDARPVALPFVLASRPAEVAAGWEEDLWQSPYGWRLEPQLTIADDDGDANLEPPMVRPYLEDMATFLEDFQAFLSTVGGITTPVTTIGQASAALESIKSAAQTLASQIFYFKGRVEDGARGQLPYVRRTLFLGRGIQPT